MLRSSNFILVFVSILNKYQVLNSELKLSMLVFRGANLIEYEKGYLL